MSRPLQVFCWPMRSQMNLKMAISPLVGLPLPIRVGVGVDPAVDVFFGVGVALGPLPGLGVFVFVGAPAAGVLVGLASDVLVRARVAVLLAAGCPLEPQAIGLPRPSR